MSLHFHYVPPKLLFSVVFFSIWSHLMSMFSLNWSQLLPLVRIKKNLLDLKPRHQHINWGRGCYLPFAIKSNVRLLQTRLQFALFSSIVINISPSDASLSSFSSSSWPTTDAKSESVFAPVSCLPLAAPSFIFCLSVSVATRKNFHLLHLLLHFEHLPLALSLVSYHYFYILAQTYVQAAGDIFLRFSDVQKIVRLSETHISLFLIISQPPLLTICGVSSRPSGRHPSRFTTADNTTISFRNRPEASNWHWRVIWSTTTMPRSGAHQPLVRHDTDDGGETGQSVKSLADVSEEEIDSRMSRRSSVIVSSFNFNWFQENPFPGRSSLPIPSIIQCPRSPTYSVRKSKLWRVSPMASWQNILIIWTILF